MTYTIRLIVLALVCLPIQSNAQAQKYKDFYKSLVDSDIPSICSKPYIKDSKKCVDEARNIIEKVHDAVQEDYAEVIEKKKTKMDGSELHYLGLYADQIGQFCVTNGTSENWGECNRYLSVFARRTYRNFSNDLNDKANSAAISTGSLSDDDPNTFVVVSTHIDNVRGPKNIFDTTAECANNNSCIAVIKAASTYYGVPADKVVSGVAILNPMAQGEGTYNDLTLPTGYLYCKASMNMISIVPHDGDRGSLFLASTRPNGIYYETWTPKQGLGGGNSWVEATITVLGVKEGSSLKHIQAGTCQSGVPARTLFYCRGGGCINTVDAGQNVDSSSPPGAGSRK